MALPWAQPAARITYYDACASLAGLGNHFFIREASKGTPMMRKAHLDRHLRIIGVPRRSVAKYSGGLPMMRFAQRSCAYRIIGMPSAPSCILRRRTANDAVVTTWCVLPHHWHAFRAFCIVFTCIVSYSIRIFKTSMELSVFMMHLLGFKQRLLLQTCCEPLRNSTKHVAKLLRYRCETVAKALRGCREAVAMLSRRRHEADDRLLRIGSKMTTVFFVFL